MIHGPAIKRRPFLTVGALAPLGLTVNTLPQLQAARSRRPKSCIWLFLYGGPSHLDMWDLKPDAPAEFRGEFRPAASTVPGVQLCEYMPRTAKLAKHFTILRALTHANKNHNPAAAWVLTGVNPGSDNARELRPTLNDPPGLPALAGHLAPGSPGVPSALMMPAKLFDQGTTVRGHTGGWLGPASDPLIVTGDPSAPDFKLDAYEPYPDLTRERLLARRQLLETLNSPAGLTEFHDRAFQLLGRLHGRSPFDLAAEPPAVRERYGATTFGQGCLLARRLVEAGTRLVTVSDASPAGHHQWDTHNDNFAQLRDLLLPKLDRAYSALLEDLLARGLLDDTVVFLGGEFGRTPRIGLSTGAGANPSGRDHWPDCFGGLVAGGGFTAGSVYGASDARGAYPREGMLTPEDMAATLLAAMGLDPLTTVTARDGRPMPASHGRVATGLLR